MSEEAEFIQSVPKYGLEGEGTYHRLIKEDDDEGHWASECFELRHKKYNGTIVEPTFRTTWIKPRRLNPITAKEYYEARGKAIAQLLETQPPPTNPAQPELEQEEEEDENTGFRRSYPLEIKKVSFLSKLFSRLGSNK